MTTAGKTIPPSNVPLTPPSPGNTTQTSPPISIPPKEPLTASIPPPQKPPKRKPRRFVRFLLYLITLSALGFSGGVYYSLVSDNFHDFFTEYIPFGEDAVLYFEEREFRRRFPRALSTSHRRSDEAQRITIPSNSGISSKERGIQSGGSDLETKGRHMSAVEDNQAAQTKPSPGITPPPTAPSAKPTATQAGSSNKSNVVPNIPKESPKAKDEAKKPEIFKSSNENSTNPSLATPTKLPEVNEPSVFLPIIRVDPLSIKDADEPLVQDLVKMLNDIIAVVNADSASSKFGSSIIKAKKELTAVGQKIMALKAAQQKSADDRVKATQAEFDQSARELIRRLEQEMRSHEAQWRDEFESERRRIAGLFDEQFKADLATLKQVSEQQVKNQLLEQSIALKKEFAGSVKQRVENERQGRLARLSDLSSSLDELESLTKQWNSVLDANLRTQHLQVAVESVRSNLETADRPRPFVRELAALKELAAESPVIDSAIASINPTAYQLGVPTSAQLVDRFRRVAEEVRKASLLPEDAGIASHAASFLLSKVMVKKQGRATGDDVESVLTRAESLLEEGNLDEAAREVNTLQGWAKTLSRDWLGEVRKVLEVRQALDVSANPLPNLSKDRLLISQLGHCYRSTTSKSQSRLIKKMYIILYNSSKVP